MSNEDWQRWEGYIARDWWDVTKPGGETVEVFVTPGQTQREMRALYSRCVVVAT